MTRTELAHHIVRWMTNALPPDGSGFSVEDRARWLRAVASVLQWGHQIDGTISIEVRTRG